MKIYHNSRCAKSRAGMKFINDGGYEVEVVNYLTETPFTVETLSALIQKTGMKPEELVRKQETTFKAEFKGKSLTDEEWIKAMVENPKLIHRPIVEKGDKAVLAQPPEKIQEIL